jgi:hypothetical protein
MSLLEQFNKVTGQGWTTAGKDVQYKVIDDTLYFQCSNGKSDWDFNFMAWGDVYKDSQVKFIGHKGFNELWESIRHDIEKLSFHKIVGYSQGAALAIRAHENFYHRMGFEPDVTITFGCPPSILNPSKKLKSRFSHVVNYHNPRDLVYFIPMVLGYKHVGQCVKLTGKASKPSGYKLLTWLSGHSPAEYRQRTAWV